MKRLEKGETYYFISVPYWKVAHTEECYFGTDNERYEAGNYFTDIADAKRIFAEIDDKFGDALERNKQRQRGAKQDLFVAVGALVKRAKEQRADDSPREVVKDLVAAHDKYRKTLTALNKETTEATEKIMQLIRRASK